MKNLEKSIFDLIIYTSTELPQDVIVAINNYSKKEKNKRAKYIFDIIKENIKISKKGKLPICQDTGTLNFYISLPNSSDQEYFIKQINKAVANAIRQGFLRDNSIPPQIYFEINNKKQTQISLILKGGGSENVSSQYFLPNDKLNAEKDNKGIKKCIIDSIIKAKGMGCAPGILGICIGGDRATGYLYAKKQLLRKLNDKNPNKELAKLENDILKQANKLDIGPMGLGGNATILGCKIGKLNHHPASFFVTISYMCWALRRQTIILSPGGGKIIKTSFID